MRRMAPAVVGLVLCGCYPDRLTTHFDTAFELTNTDDDSAILDETARTEEEEARIQKRLMELEMEDEPVYHMNAGDEIEIRVYDHPDLSLIHI